MGAGGLQLGATPLAWALLEELGVRWRVMLDPEGNEFCLVLGD